MAIVSMSTSRLAGRAGVGLRLPHLVEAVATPSRAAWFEVHPENVLANPHALELLEDLVRHVPISLHTVGLSVGSVTGLDRAHLARVRALVSRLDPVLVSGHLAWSTHGDEYLNDLLPLPYTTETLALVAAQLAEVQDALGRPFLLENPSNYLGFAGSTMTETAFLNELVARHGARLLCDVSNVHVSAHNLGYDARAYLEALPLDAIDELHLGGFTPEDDAASPTGQVLIDTHATHVGEAAWTLYGHACERFGDVPTLVEWDDALPPLATLLDEAAHADRIAAAVTASRRIHVPA